MRRSVRALWLTLFGTFPSMKRRAPLIPTLPTARSVASPPDSAAASSTSTGFPLATITSASRDSARSSRGAPGSEPASTSTSFADRPRASSAALCVATSAVLLRSVPATMRSYIEVPFLVLVFSAIVETIAGLQRVFSALCLLPSRWSGSRFANLADGERAPGHGDLLPVFPDNVDIPHVDGPSLPNGPRGCGHHARALGPEVGDVEVYADRELDSRRAVHERSHRRRALGYDCRRASVQQPHGLMHRRGDVHLEHHPVGGDLDGANP